MYSRSEPVEASFFPQPISMAGTRESASAEAANLAKRFIVNSSKTAGCVGNLIR